MDDIKKLFKRMIITTIIFLVFGIITKNLHIIIGFVSGCIISILSLYILSVDVKAIAYSKEVKIAKRMAILSYLKRYVLYMVYLASILYFFDFKYFFSGVIGLFIVRFNIYLIVLEEKIKKLKKNRK